MWVLVIKLSNFNDFILKENHTVTKNIHIFYAAKEDFIDQRAVGKIKEKLPHVMPVSCYRLGVDGANIVFQSKVSFELLVDGLVLCP